MNSKQCLASFVNINGIDAWMLWDSGSTMSRITLTFAQIANIKVNELLDPHTLQLGTVGSWSVVKYGATVDLSIQGQQYPTYLDIVNFDHYDMILGPSGRPKDPKVKVKEVPDIDSGTQHNALGVVSPLLINNGDDNEVATNIATARSTRPALYKVERSMEPHHGRHGEDPDVSGGDYAIH
ncbi:hypothetical protein P691DRAFT_790882 [Macrolepiota fuliginosa MF-IS2]|uniref:Uncharacterized protein n=1 Tax=Macrolepiota fuliginosa MF-IS2 TaxID=1400762 RepID=A0A9P5X2F1_9AGAR|nr:hypothetical protein P691DRAFT_790882 [Macrolepiota fuliginosa MF-IS2]